MDGSNEGTVQVSLINHSRDPEATVAVAARPLTSNVSSGAIKVGMSLEQVANLLSQLFAAGRLSPFEHTSFTLDTREPIYVRASRLYLRDHWEIVALSRHIRSEVAKVAPRLAQEFKPEYYHLGRCDEPEGCGLFFIHW